MHDSILRHPALGQGLAGIALRREATIFPVGEEDIDRVLGGGLARAQLHEIFAIDPEDAAAATGFAAMLALRIAPPGSTILWLREDPAHRRAILHAPGLAEIGFDLARLIVGVLPDALSALRAGVDALHCAGIGIVILELWRDPAALNLTASRRLALAAETAGVTPLLLRIGARPSPSVARTRWQVSAGPSQPCEANAPGFPAFNLSLLRRRGGPAGMRWYVEWDRDAGCFRKQALSSDCLPLSPDGSVAAGRDPGLRTAV